MKVMLYQLQFDNLTNRVKFCDFFFVIIAKLHFSMQEPNPLEG